MKLKYRQNFLIALIALVLLAAFLASSTVCAEIHTDNCSDEYCLLCAAINFLAKVNSFLSVALICVFLFQSSNISARADRHGVHCGISKTLVDLKAKLTS